MALGCLFGAMVICLGCGIALHWSLMVGLDMGAICIIFCGILFRQLSP